MQRNISHGRIADIQEHKSRSTDKEKFFVQTSKDLTAGKYYEQ